ncbi:MAG: VOC family protein [Victivallaceae bacterium]|nr:VOC family protein [Victivallaceae bacterium]
MRNLIKIRHFGLVVRDLGKALHFYRDLLGFEVFADNLETGDFINTIIGGSNIEVRTVKMGVSPDAALIELLDFGSRRQDEIPESVLFDYGPRHIALEVQDIERIYSLLNHEGYSFISRPCISPDGKVKVAFCHGPENQYIEFVEVL